MLNKKLNIHFQEANKHINLIKESLEVLKPKLPIKDYKNLNQLEKFALNTFIFRFSKLQNLIDTKIFIDYLNFNGFNISDKNFFKILIEKEKIIDIDSWNNLQKLKNITAQEFDKIVENINLFIIKSDLLIKLSKKLEQKYIEIQQQKDNHN